MKRHQGDRILRHEVFAQECDGAIDGVEHILEAAGSEHEDECPVRPRRETVAWRPRPRHEGLWKEVQDLALALVLVDLEI